MTFVIVFLLPHLLSAQTLKPGVDRDELLEVMYVSARTGRNVDYVNTGVKKLDG
ncbi:MAG: hypothetical protein ACP5DZ_03025 [Bacteroidales bacterium]